MWKETKPSLTAYNYSGEAFIKSHPSRDDSVVTPQIFHSHLILVSGRFPNPAQPMKISQPARERTHFDPEEKYNERIPRAMLSPRENFCLGRMVATLYAKWGLQRNLISPLPWAKKKIWLQCKRDDLGRVWATLHLRFFDSQFQTHPFLYGPFSYMRDGIIVSTKLRKEIGAPESAAWFGFASLEGPTIRLLVLFLN